MILGTITQTGRKITAWRGVDLLTAAMIGVAFGVIFWGFDTLVYPGIGLLAAGFPPAAELALGVWLLPAVVGGLIIRRPGAAIFTELVAANLELLLGNQWGPGVLVSGVLQGLGVEVVLLFVLWRRFSLTIAMIAGVAAAVLEIVGYEWWAYVADYTLVWKLVYLAFGMLSGAVIAGVGGWLLVRALARTGALQAFPVGHEARESAISR